MHKKLSHLQIDDEVGVKKCIAVSPPRVHSPTSAQAQAQVKYRKDVPWAFTKTTQAERRSSLAEEERRCARLSAIIGASEAHLNGVLSMRPTPVSIATAARDYRPTHDRRSTGNCS